MKIEDIAKLCHNTNANYCHLLGDNSQEYWEDAPQWQKDSAVLGVTKIMHGEITTPSQSHVSWYKQKEADGWIYGPVKDPEKKEHPCMVHYLDLPIEQQIKDELFFCIAKACEPLWRQYNIFVITEAAKVEVRSERT